MRGGIHQAMNIMTWHSVS